MENYTKNGLIFLMIGIIIGIISTGLLGIFQFISPDESTSNIFSFIGFGIIGAIGGLLVLIGGILFLVGRKEFGEKHQKFVLYAVIIFIVGLVISSIIAGIGTFISISQSFAGGTEIDTSMMGYSIIISTIIGSITGGLTYVFALYELEDDKGKRILYLAFIVSIIIGIIIGFLSLGAIETLIEDIPIDGSPTDFTSTFGFTSQITQYSTLSVISNILWLITLYLPYKRIKNGDLIPQVISLSQETQTIPERICPNCQKNIPTDANICPYCGKTFQDYL
jgi:MFS family permease